MTDIHDLDALRLLHRIGGTEFLRSIITVFIAQAPLQIGAVERGIEDRDFTAVGQACHSLKSSAAQLGAAELSRLCASGEHLAAAESWPELMRDAAGLTPAFQAARAWLERMGHDGFTHSAQ